MRALADEMAEARTVLRWMPALAARRAHWRRGADVRMARLEGQAEEVVAILREATGEAPREPRTAYEATAAVQARRRQMRLVRTDGAR
jgi:hypothetical protein